MNPVPGRSPLLGNKFGPLEQLDESASWSWLSFPALIQDDCLLRVAAIRKVKSKTVSEPVQSPYTRWMRGRSPIPASHALQSCRSCESRPRDLKRHWPLSMARARLRSPECTEPWTHYCGLRLARGDLRLARGKVRRQSGAKGAFCNFIIFDGAPQQNPDSLHSENFWLGI
jgi:hypothetical protein